MRLFQSVWHYSAGGAWTDKTTTADTGMALAVAAGDKLYFSMEDWVSGVLFFLTAPCPNSVSYTVSLWDGDDWRDVHLEDVYRGLAQGYTFGRAYSFASDGAAYWGRSPYAWGVNTASWVVGPLGWPENSALTCPSFPTGYWIKITFTAVTGTMVLSKLYPMMYNTYTSYNHVAAALQLAPFTDISAPEVSIVRHTIRDQEDFLDHYCRRTWRYRTVWAEAHNFNPYGIRLRVQPPLIVTSLGLWQGANVENMTSGRYRDWFLDPYSGMVIFMLPSFRLRYYSFLLSRYLRQPFSVLVDYIAGLDFETSPQQADVQHITLRLAIADLIRNSDQTGWLSSGLNELSKDQKIETMVETAMERADQLRQIVML